MIQDENTEQEPSHDSISDADKVAFFEISKWTRLISSIGFTIGAFIVVVMLFSGAQILKTLAGSIPSFEGMYALLVAGFFVLFFVTAMVLYYLHKTSVLLKGGIQQENEHMVAQAFVYLKYFFVAVTCFAGLQLLINFSNFL